MYSIPRFSRAEGKKLRQETVSVFTCGMGRDPRLRNLHTMGRFADCGSARYRDGIALSERVRNRFPDIPFVLCTTSGAEKIAGTAFETGIDGYVPTETDESRATELSETITRVTTDARRPPSDSTIISPSYRRWATASTRWTPRATSLPSTILCWICLGTTVPNSSANTYRSS
ncbi:hypothetical protein ACFFQF_25280 [Haladaptatus pallidirubidus]|uniref:hypothetical protein n=1 Tax=Haladaptatus pallidirubidus TaxID=1008152 RepID=UPI0035EA2363